MKHSLLGYWSYSLKKSAVIAALVAGSALVAHASLTINVTQVGLDVVASGSGSFNLDSLTLTLVNVGGNSGYLEAQSFIPSAGSATSTDWYTAYSDAGNPTNFGTGGGFSADSNSTAGFFVLIPGYFGSESLLEVAAGYLSNTTFSVSSTWSNQTIQSLGLLPGTYTWQWSKNSDGSGARDSVTVNVVPEPSTYGLVIAGLVFVTLGMRKRRPGFSDKAQTRGRVGSCPKSPSDIPMHEHTRTERNHIRGMKFFGLLLSCLTIGVLPSARAIEITSSGVDSVVWQANNLSLPSFTLSLGSNPGNIFNSTSFSILYFVDDRAIQSAHPFAAITYLLGASVNFSAQYLRADSVIDNALVFGAQTSFVQQSALQNNATNGADNYLGITYLDGAGATHYGWLQFSLNQFSNGATAADFLSGYVNPTAGQSVTAGAVPEPSSIMLGAFGLGALALVVFRRRMTAAA